MTRSYRFRLAFHTLHVVRRGAPAPIGAQPLRRQGVLWHITGLGGVPFHDGALQELLSDLGFPNMLPQTLDLGERMELEERFDRALEGRFELWEVPRRAGAGSRPLRQAAPTATEDEKPLGPESDPDPKTWIEIRVLDDSGNPVPNVAYRVICPDQTVRAGTTNLKGSAREEGLIAGQCQVTFPEIDVAALSKAS